MAANQVVPKSRVGIVFLVREGFDRLIMHRRPDGLIGSFSTETIEEDDGEYATADRALAPFLKGPIGLTGIIGPFQSDGAELFSLFVATIPPLDVFKFKSYALVDDGLPFPEMLAPSLRNCENLMALRMIIHEYMGGKIRDEYRTPAHRINSFY